MDGNAFKHRVRQRSAEFLNEILPGSMYAQYRLDQEEFVGRIDTDLEDVEAYLEGEGYEYQVLAARKLHPEREEADHGSYRCIDPSDGAKQWHVHLWETPDGVELFSHYEYRPEPWGPWDRNRVPEHYRAEWGSTYIEGQHSEAVKRLLEEDGVYEGDPERLGNRVLEPPSTDFRDIFA